MTNNAIIQTLRPGNVVRLLTVDTRTFTGQVNGNGKQLWIDFVGSNGGNFTIEAHRLNRCLGTLEVVR